MSRELSLGSPSSKGDAIYKLWRKFTAAFSTAGLQTGQHWTDGSVVRRKVIAIPAGPNSSTVSTAHGITGLGKVLAVSCWLDNGTTQIPCPYADDAAAAANIELSITDTNVVLISGASGDYSSYAGQAIIDYLDA